MDKPRRKYTVTEKALAANRRNLVRAREVDTEIRFRTTPKRLAACRANISRAHAVLRAASLTRDGFPQKSEIANQTSEIDPSPALARQPTKITRHWPDSPAYGTAYTRGLYAVSLRRSARLAGEASGAFDAHVARFITALAPRTERERRLARGIAETVWRRLRAFRGQARYEHASLGWLLQRTADGRDLMWMRAGRPSPGPFAQEGEAATLLPAERAANLAWAIDRTLSSDLDMLDSAEKLNQRLERLSRLYVAGRGGDPRLFESTAPGRVRDGRLAERSPESMGNPFLHPCAVAAGLEFPLGAGARPGSRCHQAGDGSPRWRNPEDAADEFLRFQMMREYCRIPGPEGGGKEPGPRELSEMEELWRRAWEAVASHGYNSSSVSISGYAPSETSGPAPGGGNSSSPAPGPSIAHTLWSRLQLYAQAAQGEEAEVNRLLDAKINGRMRKEFKTRLGEIRGGAPLLPAQDRESGVFLMELILLFSRSSAGVADQRITGKALADLLHAFLVEQWGPSDHFKVLDSSSDETYLQNWLGDRRRDLEKRWMHNSYLLAHRPAHEPDAAEGIRRGEENVKVAAEMIALARFTEGFDEDILDPWPDALLNKICAHQPMDPDYASRYLAAAATGMLPLEGWNFESQARCQARVGLKKEEGVSGED